MKEWTLDLGRYAKVKGDSVKVCRKKIVAKLFENIVMRTPVDTGRARGNWQISVGRDDDGTIERFSKGTPSYLPQECGKLDGCRGDTAIYIHNNLPYIESLEYGHSKQAPNGMLGVTLAGVAARVAEAVKESGF